MPLNSSLKETAIILLRSAFQLVVPNFRCLVILLLAIISLAPASVYAGTTNQLIVPLRNPGAPVPPGAPPPIGSGLNAPPLIPGDAGASAGPPSGTALQPPINGSKFQAVKKSPRSIVNVVMDVPQQVPTFNVAPFATRNQPGGSHVVLTFRTDALSAEQAQQVHGILGSAMDNPSPNETVSASESEIEQLQNILYPNPSENAQMIRNGPNASQQAKSLKVNAKPADGYPKPGRDPTPWFVRNDGGDGAGEALESGKLSYKSQLTTVRGFCRYLVLLGVIFATVFMIISAYGVINGERNAGARIVAAASGLCLLLSAYTIWKIAVTNSNRFPDTRDQALNPRWRKKGDTTDQNQPTVLYRGKIWDKNTPGSSSSGSADYAPNSTPTSPASMVDSRSNMKVQPLGGSRFR